jgi:Flp pilus assembly protein TadD
VYEDILERQVQGVPVDEKELKDLPAMTAADYERLGDTYLGRGQFALARAKYAKALDLEPRNWMLEYKIGTISLRLNAPNDAMPYFRSIIARDPMNAYGYEGEGRTLLALKDHEGAEKALKKSVSLNSSNWKAWQALGMVYDDVGRINEAITAYQKALKIRPTEGSILNNLGVAYYLNKDYPKSIESLERALHSTRPEDRRRVYNNLGRAYARSGQWSRAVDSFRRGSDLATAYNNVGLVLMEMDRPGDAAACFQKAIDTKPNYYQAGHDNLTVAKDRSGGRMGSCPTS